MLRITHRLTALALAAAWLGLAAAATAQAPPPGKPGARGRPAPPAQTPAKDASAGPAETRIRLVLDVAGSFGSVSYSDVRTPTEYAEKSQVRSSYDAGSGFVPDLALQASLFRGLGILVGYSYVSRDVSGTVDVSRPHPLYLNQPRSASAELSGLKYSESAIHLDLAYAKSVGSLDWALFAGVSLFTVEADLLDAPTYDESYPYDELQILSTPSRKVDDSPTGFNVGGRLDYRFGSSKRFGVGVQVRYSSATASLKANDDVSTPASVDAGGFSAGAGVRLYF